MTLSINDTHNKKHKELTTLSINNTRHNDTHYNSIECRYAECQYAECRYAECPGACMIKLITAVIYGFCNKLECVLVNTRLSWKGLPVTNTLAYYGNRKLRP